MRANNIPVLHFCGVCRILEIRERLNDVQGFETAHVPASPRGFVFHALISSPNASAMAPLMISSIVFPLARRARCIALLISGARLISI